jgi:hypothetical protein
MGRLEGGDGDLGRVNWGEGGNGEGTGGIPRRENSSKSATASLSLSNSSSQHRFPVRLAGGRLTDVGEGAGGGAWCEVDDGGSG